MVFCVGLVARLLACGGLSDACRRPSSFSLLAHATAGSGGERRSRPEGRRAGCPESREVTKRNGLFNTPGLQAGCFEVFGATSCLRDIRYGHAAPYPEAEGDKAQSLAALRAALALFWLLLLRAGARCSWGPYAAVRRGRSGRAAGVAMDGNAFSTGQEARPKSPAAPHGLGGQEARRAPHRGGLLFGLLFSWPRKRKVTRAPAGARNRFEICG